MIIRTFLVSLAIGVIACASAAVVPQPELEATLSRGGGLHGIRETIRVWSANADPHASVQQSNEDRPRIVRLPKNTLDSVLVILDSAVHVVPAIPPDTGALRPLCGDVILTHIEVRRGSSVHSAQEECPHRTAASTAYWQRVDSLFRLLQASAR